MPQIIVRTTRGDGTVTWSERVNASDFDSAHFERQLVERIGWAVRDAHDIETDAARQPLSGRETETDADSQPASSGAARDESPTLSERRHDRLVHT